MIQALVNAKLWVGLASVCLPLGCAALWLGLRAPAAPARPLGVRIREGLGAAPLAAVTGAGAWLALHAWAALNHWGEPSTWIIAGATKQDPTPHVATALAVLAGAAVMAALALAVLGSRASARQALPELVVKGALVSIALTAFGLVMILANLDRASAALPADVVVVVPLLVLLASLEGLRLPRPIAPEPQVGDAEPEQPARLSPEEALALLRAHKAVGASATPLQPRTPPGTRSGSAQSTLWSCVAPRGYAFPPRMLPWWSTPAARVLVPDVPHRSAHALIELLVAGAALRGEHAIALVSDPHGSERRLRAALERVHLDSPYAIAIGLGGIEQANRERECPLIALVTLADLCALPARLLSLEHARPLAASERLCLWLGDTADWSGADLCHLALALRALAAVRATEGSPGGTWIYGEGTEGLRDWLADVLGAPVALEPPGWPSGKAAASIYAGPALERARPNAAPELRMALGAAMPPATFELIDRIAWSSAEPSAAVSMDSSASLKWIWASPADLVGLVRAALHRPAHEDCTTVVSTVNEPLSRLLLDPTVRWVEHAPERRLPMFRANALIAAAHVEALLGSGQLCEGALTWIFGEALVAGRLKRNPRPVATQAKVMHGVGDAVWRGVTWQVSGATATTPYRPTVTAAPVAYLDPITRKAVRYADRDSAVARMPPWLVFGAAGKLYQVPDEARQPGAEVTLLQAPPGAQLNHPIVQSAVSWTAWLEEPASVQRQAVQLTIARAEVEVQERIDQLVPRGQGRQHAVHIQPVEARYGSRARVIYFASDVGPAALEGIRAGVEDLLPMLIAALPGDLSVHAQHGFGPISGCSALVLYDRHVRGLGAAEALDVEGVWTALRWARDIVAACTCTDGCSSCIPRNASSFDKPGLLRALRITSARS